MFKASLFVGIFSLLICVLFWALLSLSLSKNEFNPLEDAIDDAFVKIERFLHRNVTLDQESNLGEKEENKEKFVQNIKTFVLSLVTPALAISIVYALSCILMMIGASSKKTRGLILPYIFLQSFLIVTILCNTIVLNLTLFTLPQNSVFPSYILCFLYYVVILPYFFLTLETKRGLFWLSIAYLSFVCVFTLTLGVSYSHTTTVVLLSALNSLHIPLIACFMVMFTNLNEEAEDAIDSQFEQSR